MPRLTVCNPATGTTIARIPADDAQSVAAKAGAARAAQPKWVGQPIVQRLACIERFRAAIVLQLDALAAVMTSETGKPITASRNELNRAGPGAASATRVSG